MNQVIIYGVNDWGYLSYWDYNDKVNVLAFTDQKYSSRNFFIMANKIIVPLNELSSYKHIPVVVAESDNDKRNAAIKYLQGIGMAEIKIYTPPEYMTADYAHKLLLARSRQALLELENNRSIDLGNSCWTIPLMAK